MRGSRFDRAHIVVKSGKGGDGASSFRREKFVPFGGPDGGDGGRGGKLYLVADETEDTLLRFRGRPRFAAQEGGRGQGSKKTGPRGEDMEVGVPLGTIAVSEGEFLGEVMKKGDRLLVARGGMGGWGNARFSTATDRAPKFALRGEPAEERPVELELKLIADVGLIGYPNAGKSSFLRAVTRATPKVADYPFTTLQPNLGVAEVGNQRFVIADLPGLIEGASQGVGLGLEFLRHAERTRVLLHIVDGSNEDPLSDFQRVTEELLAYGRSLPGKPRIVAINKVDLPVVQERIHSLIDVFCQTEMDEAYAISTLTGEGLEEVMERLAGMVPQVEASAVEEPAEDATTIEAGEGDFKVYHPTGRGYQIEREGDAFRVRHRRLERLAGMVDPSSRGAVNWYKDRLSRLGVASALQRQGVKSGDRVRVGNLEMEW